MVDLAPSYLWKLRFTTESLAIYSEDDKSFRFSALIAFDDE